ncbi:hydrocephalus-inducing protein homolog [Acridotheres tristis]
MASGFQGRGAEPRTRMLLREAEKPLTLSPSALQKEMSLTTKQRLARSKKLHLPLIVQPQDEHETSHHKFSAADPKQSSLLPCPAEVVFQNYSPGEVCEMPVVLRNRDKVPLLVKVILESSPYFQLEMPSNVYCKVPPGLSVTVRILFSPGQNKDYFHQLLCITETEELIVPIRAIGARAILDFPDELDFSECPVKYSTQKTLLVQNLGNRAAHYQLSTQSPFFVIPATGTLGIGDSVQVTVGVLPLRTGDCSTSLVVHYDTGEDTHTSLHGRAVDANIRLDRNAVTFQKTYVTLSNRAAVLIHNLSDVTACFQWTAVDTEGEEDLLKLRQYRRLCQQTKDNLSDSLKECGVDSTGQECFALLTHSLQSERAKVRGDAMLFCDGIFSLEPKEGEIRPKCSAEISVFFKPQEARLYQQAVYCDISGRENRLPLHLIGEGLGPRLCFNLKELNIGEVCVSTNNRYEVILFNTGPAEALFILLPPATAMGSFFTFLPQEGIVAPYRLQAIRISFHPTVMGEFQEEFCFHVTGSPKPVTLTIRGRVTGPTFHFDVPALHFGDVSFGFPRTLKCCLSNTSMAPMAVKLHVAGDGSGALSIDSFAQMRRHSNQSWRKEARGPRGPVDAKEFIISPCGATVRALGSEFFNVTLCSNTVREYQLELVVDVIGVGNKWLTLPLTARCIVPALRLLNPVVSFEQCFLKFPYKEKVTLVNDSDFPGCYRVLSQERKEKAAAWYSSSEPSGIIEAHSSVEIPITLEAQQLGECNVTAEVAVFGREGSPLEFHLECMAHGPVVSIDPEKINFGAIRVLEDRSKIVHLKNHGDIPAPFWVKMHCRISPAEKGRFIGGGYTGGTSHGVGSVAAPLAGEAARKGPWLGAEWDVLPAGGDICERLENSFEKRFDFLYIGWLQLLELVKASPDTVDSFVFVDKASGVARKHSRWRIEPTKGVVLPKSEVLVTVTGNLNDTKQFKDRMKVFIENSHPTIISVQAVGTGPTIVTDKPLGSVLDLTTHFSFSPCRYRFNVTNKGRRVHRLYWSTEGFSVSGQSARLPALRGTKSRDASRDHRAGSSVFKVRPQQVDLRPRQTVEMVLEGCSSTAQEVKEWLLCYATVGKEIEKKQIMQVDVTCKFIHPVVETSSREITFHVEKKPSDVLALQYQPLSLKNVCSLPFSIVLDLEQPFRICNVDQQPLPAGSKPMMLDVGEELHLCIQFDPAYEKDLNSRVAERALRMRFMEHPHEEQITVRGEVYFPNLHLQAEAVDFGCIINRTEQELHMEMTNCGPIPAQYHWSFLTDPHVNTIRFKPSPPEFKRQSSKKGGFPRRYSKTESVEGPSETPKTIQNSAQQPADAEDSLKAGALSSTAVEPQKPVRKKRLGQISKVKHPKPGMQEVFDVQPLWGELQPGESQLVTFTFFGHDNIVARVTALCHVEGGPTYEVVVTGEASPLATNWMWKKWTEGCSPTSALLN